MANPVPPRRVVSPLAEDPLPEVVEEGYFSVAAKRRTDIRIENRRVVWGFGAKQRRATMARIHRFRDDVTGRFSGSRPHRDLASVDVWVDPAVGENDFDGFTAEALVIGLPVVATRTAINILRLEQGRIGFLVPPRDPNEMTHVILSALFKTEVAENKQLAARQTVSKFRARHRLRILNRLYDIVKNA